MMWSGKTIVPQKPMFIQLLKGLKMILNIPAIRSIMRIALTVDWGRSCMDKHPPKNLKTGPTWPYNRLTRFIGFG